MLRILLCLLALLPAAATAGTRAIFGVENGAPRVVQIADNGDVDAEMSGDRRLIVRGGETFVVSDRLTGPLVVRLADVVAVVAEREARRSRQRVLHPLVQRAPLAVNGRTGRAFVFPAQEGTQERLFAVMSDDPGLEELGRVMRSLFTAQSLISRLEEQYDPQAVEWERALLGVLEQGAPLQWGGWTLRSLEQVPIAPATIVLPAAPESAEVLQARIAAQGRAEDASREDRMILRAAFAAGRLWLLTDSGALTSLADGETRRTRHDLGGRVLDICASGATPLALTGRRDGRSWAVQRLEGARWTPIRSIQRAGDIPVALSCSTREMLVTTRRLIDLEHPGAAPLVFAEPLEPALVRSVVHVASDAVFVGLNAGEWGGGLRRIDRRTGRIDTIERNATGELCGGPLNTACDPVNGIAPIPWRPDCVAAAVGLIHMMAHGRVVRVCADEVEQLIAVADDIDPEDARAVADAARGNYGAVAFFGIERIGDTPVAVGHNGLHRITADGSATHQRWPRFTQVDGVLVSFALPDVVLVLTGLNGRASLSGATPLLVVR